MFNNLLLRSLGEDEDLSKISQWETVQLSPDQVIYRAGDRLEYIYFPESSLVSLLTMGEDGRGIETGIVGREGLVGGDVILGTRGIDGEAVVQIGGVALRVPTAQVLDTLHASPALWSRVSEHLNFLFSQARQNIFCHAMHSIESRFCRWLLQARDRLESATLEVTQESCAQLLGTQRTSLSMIAHALQVDGAIITRRGKIELVNRPLLLERACECYAKLKQSFDALYGESAGTLKGAPRSRPAVGSPGRDVTVLVIDDDTVFSYAAGRYFEANGYRVIFAHSATEAVGLIESTKIDAVVTDIRLGRGELDGFELASLIKKRIPDMPLIFVTAYPDMLRGRSLLGEKIFLKPVEISQLCRAIKDRLAA